MFAFRHILVPLDGSPLAERSIAPALRIARGMLTPASQGADGAAPPVRLTLMRAVSPTTMVAADPMLYEELVRMSEDEAHAYLRAVVEKLDEADVAVGAAVLDGSPAEAIVRYAEEHAVDLILISSHGRTGSSRWVYGSVAEKVLHHAPCAVGVIRSQVETDMFEKRTILVPLDGSKLAEQALEPALALARYVGCDVMLMRVLGAVEPVPEGMVMANQEYQSHLDAARDRERADAESYLQRIYAANETQHLFFDVVPSTGDVADAITTYAATHHVDLIVISSHGRSGVSRWLYGSVAEKVLRGAHCATLVVRGQAA